MNTQMNIQDIFLNKARIKKIPLVVYLVNGFQFRGTVKAFDNFTVVMENEHGQQSLVYKHAISTVIPAADIEVLAQDND